MLLHRNLASGLCVPYIHLVWCEAALQWPVHKEPGFQPYGQYARGVCRMPGTRAERGRYWICRMHSVEKGGMGGRRDGFAEKRGAIEDGKTNHFERQFRKRQDHSGVDATGEVRAEHYTGM